MKKIISILLLVPLISFSQKANKKSIDSLTVGMEVSKGLINTYKNSKNQLFFEVNKDILEKDFLVVTRFAQLPANYSGYLNAGSKTAEHVVEFEKKFNKILLREVSYNNIADSDDPISISVSENNFKPILASFDIKNSDENRYLIEVTDYFMSDSPGFNIIRSYEKSNYKIGNVDKKRSFIDSARSFPKNTEVLHTLTFNVNKAPRENRTKTFSFQINHSIILLPDDLMPVRYEDERVGWFTLQKINYSSDKLKSDSYKIVRRWRLVPSDLDAYMKGELVEPVKPIVYYLDPGTPLKWRKYFKMGIEDWNSAFEKAGFKNAIIAKDPPSKEEDPDFSPEDVRYSTVRYLASPSLNANGPHVSDPRSGEIIESDINWYHNVMKLLRNWYFVQTAAVNPEARGVEFKNEVMGELIRFVSSHEFGHTIGLPHNMGSSSAYPVDSLRSASFTKKYGTAPSIMDYARFNYVAQPGDEGVALMPSDWDTPNVGIYDIYSVKWGYKPIFDVSEDEEKEILRSWIREKEDDLIFRFGPSGGIDPSSQTEDLGDNAVKASEYGIANLKRIMPKLMEWTTEDGETYEELEYMYNQVLGQFRRYMGHVATNIGGVYQYYKTADQDGAVYTHVSKDHQKACVDFLNRNLFQTPYWMIEKDILNKIEFAGMTNRIRSVQSSSLNSVLDFAKMARMIENEALNGSNAYTLQEMMNDLKNGIWFELKNNRNIDVYRRNLQRTYINRLAYIMKNEQPTRQGSFWSNYITPIKVDVSDIRSVTVGMLISLRKELSRSVKKYSDPNIKNHLTYCIGLINNALNPKTS